MDIRIVFMPHKVKYYTVQKISEKKQKTIGSFLSRDSGKPTAVEVRKSLQICKSGCAQSLCSYIHLTVQKVFSSDWLSCCQYVE